MKTSLRQFSTSLINRKLIPNNLKGKKTSSQQWLTRQLNDPYVEKAKMLNYRCRSAFKLIEIDEKYNLLRPGSVVIDCGAAPGSWTQVAVDRVNHEGNGTVIAIDKQPIYPIQGAFILANADFTLPETRSRIVEILAGRKADVVLSDMAPSASGVKQLDDENMLGLCYTVLRFAVENGKVDGSFLVKMWQCSETKRFETDMSRFYGSVRIVKPKSSRKDSSEIYLLGRQFKGLLEKS